METLKAAYKVDEGDDVSELSTASPPLAENVDGITVEANLFASSDAEPVLSEKNRGDTGEEIKTEGSGDQQFEEDSNFGTVGAMETENILKDGPENSVSVTVKEEGVAGEEPPLKKQKHLSDSPDPTASGVEITDVPQPAEEATPALPGSGKPPSGKTGKKPKKSKDVWTTTSRKGKKKTKYASKGNHSSQNGSAGHASAEEKLFITPIPRFPDRSDDSPELEICLSKVYKAEKVDLSDDRLTASSSKGYRMVRATRGVSEGAWYFEIIVVHLGATGHTRLGWSTEKGDLQAPVGFDENSYGYRDIDGSKVHKALREKYGDEGYKEGDVIGFYVNLPDGESYAPTPRRMVWHKGQRYICAPDPGEDAPKLVPGSEISYFKNGICQGAAFTDLHGGRYYPAASMYTLPNQSACIVKFNFGPDFQNFPEDFGGRPAPKPMIEVPYQSYDDRVENGSPWNVSRMCPMVKVIKEENSKIMKATEMVG